MTRSGATGAPGWRDHITMFKPRRSAIVGTNTSDRRRPTVDLARCRLAQSTRRETVLNCAGPVSLAVFTISLSWSCVRLPIARKTSFPPPSNRKISWAIHTTLTKIPTAEKSDSTSPFSLQVPLHHHLAGMGTMRLNYARPFCSLRAGNSYRVTNLTSRGPSVCFQQLPVFLAVLATFLQPPARWQCHPLEQIE